MLNMNLPETCIFDPGAKIGTGIYSFMVQPPGGGPLVCSFGGETLEQLQQEGKVSPLALLCPWEEAEARSRDLARSRYCSGPQRVSREQWWELLEILFPARWEQLDGDCEVFMMPECITSDLYTFGVRIGEDYFSITESCGKTSRELIALCRELGNG